MSGEWTEHAKCNTPEVDPEMFFPEPDQPHEPVREFCRSCPVRRDCLTEALRVKDEFGFRGGYGPRSRRAATIAAYGHSRPGTGSIRLTWAQARALAEEMVDRDEAAAARVRRYRLARATEKTARLRDWHAQQRATAA